MAKGRILKTQISVSEQVNDLSLMAALLFTWMIPHADDWGRMTGSPRKVKAIVAPMRNDITRKDVEESLAEMQVKGLIQIYKVNNDIYLQFPNFETHQSGLHKRTESKLPSPESGQPVEIDCFSEVSGKFLEFPASCARAEQNRTEENRTEGKRREQEGGVGETYAALVLRQPSLANSACSVIAANAAVSQAEPAQRRAVSKPSPDVELIFDHWRNVMGTPKSLLNDERKRIIKRALGWGYSVDQLCEAATGCSLTPFNMGDNDRGGLYNGLKVIFKSADNIERFLSNARSPPMAANKTQKIFSGNAAVAQSWADRKKAERA